MQGSEAETEEIGFVKQVNLNGLKWTITKNPRQRFTIWPDFIGKVSSWHWFLATLCQLRSQTPSTKTSQTQETRLMCTWAATLSAEGELEECNEMVCGTKARQWCWLNWWLVEAFGGILDRWMNYWCAPCPMVRLAGRKAYIKTHITVLTYGVQRTQSPKARRSRPPLYWDSNAPLSSKPLQSRSLIHCVSGSLFKALRTLIFHRHN